jgi:hypothetical protein
MKVNLKTETLGDYFKNPNACISGETLFGTMSELPRTSQAACTSQIPLDEGINRKFSGLTYGTHLGRSKEFHIKFLS